MKDILERDKSGEPVSCDDPDYPKIKKIILEAERLTQEMNTQVLDCNEVREFFSRLTGQPVGEDFVLWPPFYTDFGKNIRVGKNVFINHACTFMDRGGISIGDNAYIGPKVCLITENHGIAPSERRMLTSRPVTLCNNVWIGAGAIVLPGVTVGENAVVGAGSVVTHDVPPDTVVAGNPARVIKSLL
ncbi:MAG: sugar O-acetyltransferase [Firmicutes bacterium]|nr:sugar O-acetyltransferase [Bacillota bacterium]